MILSGVVVNDIIQFVTKVNDSSCSQPIQNVILKVTEITATYVRGINAMRSLDMGADKKPFRSYKLENIVHGTVWKLIS